MRRTYSSAIQVQKQEPAAPARKPARKKRKRTVGGVLSTLFVVLVLTAGIGLLAYPTVSDWWNTMHQSQVLSNYMQTVSAMSDVDYSDYLEAARAYNQTLIGGTIDPQASVEAMSEYMSLLDPAGTGVMGYVSIPKINVKLPIYHGTADNVLQVAVGHIYGSSLPVGGPGTHVCLSGHTGLPRATLFTDLTELVEGDRFTLRVLDETLTYEVDQIKVVLPENVSDLTVERDKDYCTLITCTPYGVNTHRLLVRGTRVETESGPDEQDTENMTVQMTEQGIPWFLIAAAIIVIVTVAIVIVLVLKRRKAKKAR